MQAEQIHVAGRVTLQYEDVPNEKEPLWHIRKKHTGARKVAVLVVMTGLCALALVTRKSRRVVLFTIRTGMPE